MPFSFRRKLDIFLTAGVLAFLIFFTAASVQWYRINDTWLESYFFPATTDYSFTDWAQASDETWSAIVYLNKRRSECVYVSGQIETVLGTRPDGIIEESSVSYVGDESPGSNRVTGYQRLDHRFRIDKASFVEGTTFRGSVLHVCTPGRYSVTEFGPFTVGVDSVLHEDD